MTHRQIAIDGPAGAGKSTIAKLVAKKLSFVYIDTGAMYRAIALNMLRKGIDASDKETIEAECKGIDVTIRFVDGAQRVFLSGEDVTPHLRTQEVGDMASAVSVYEKVRAQMVALQQTLAREADVVMDGRDIGTVVLPGADLKIYLTASVAVRARRRYDELVAKGETPDLAEIEREIEERDTRDMTRAHSPLKKADDAEEIDSSDMTIDEVADRVLSLYAEKCDG